MSYNATLATDTFVIHNNKSNRPVCILFILSSHSAQQNIINNLIYSDKCISKLQLLRALRKVVQFIFTFTHQTHSHLRSRFNFARFDGRHSLIYKVTGCPSIFPLKIIQAKLSTAIYSNAYTGKRSVAKYLDTVLYQRCNAFDV